jgi:hypothetical protein
MRRRPVTNGRAFLAAEAKKIRWPAERCVDIILILFISISLSITQI